MFDLKPNYGGGNEDNGDLLQKVSCTQCCTQCPRPCSRPPLTHASARDSWTLTGSLGQSLVGSLLLPPGSWCAKGSVCALPESISLCTFWQLCGRLMATSPRGLMPYPGLLHAAEPLPLQQSTADLYLCRRHSNTILAQSPWGLWVLVSTRFV